VKSFWGNIATSESRVAKADLQVHVQERKEDGNYMCLPMFTLPSSKDRPGVNEVSSLRGKVWSYFSSLSYYFNSVIK
jgi:hypothetical protein